MGWLIGTDEAGYGPKLGPLVVVATIWRVPERTLAELAEVDLFERFAAAVRSPQSKTKSSGPKKKAVARTAPDERVVIGDSKSLYASGDSLAALELPAIAMWEAWSPVAASAMFSELLQESPTREWSPPKAITLPCDAPAERLTDAKARIAETFRETGSHLAGVAAEVIYPPEFNAGCQSHGNKASLLSATTLRLAANLLIASEAQYAATAEPNGECLILCDKHGGRGNYAELLPAAFHELRPIPAWVLRQPVATKPTGKRLFDDEPMPSDTRFETLVESRDQSAYRWSVGATPPREIRFTAQGEGQLPTAAASIFAKLLRELAMRSFNAFWAKHVDDLKPTAGYPSDAERFLADIEKARRKLGIDPNQFVRER